MPASVSQTELAALNALSASIGGDIRQIQGPGGNTSIKDASALYVKASGKWLANAEAEPIFVALDLVDLRRGLASDDAEVMPAALDRPGMASGLRPSIETVLHGFMHHRVVVHTHSVNALAYAVRRDGPELVARQLAGLDWRWVPYARPGAPLLRAIERAVGGTSPDVLVLANHGLVIGAGGVEASRLLLEEVERRLELPARNEPEPDLARLRQSAEVTGYRLPSQSVTHSLATDAKAMHFAGMGALFPDQVVFLGPGAPCRVEAQSLLSKQDVHSIGRGEKPPLLVIPGSGVLVREDLQAAGEANAACLALVLQRLQPDAPLVTLDENDEAALLGWDAEAYRRSLTPPHRP